jgi:glycolate oxidase FAD binding subunit
MLETKSIQEELRTIVGAGNLRPSTSDDAVCGMAPQFVVTPGTEKEMAAVLASANNAGLCVAPRGGGTKMGWGNSPRRVDVVLSTARLDQLIEHAWADLTVTVEAGCTLHKLQSMLARQGQRLAFDGLWPERATVGGALATNDSGALRMRFGSLRDLVIGVTIALPDGTLASSGGKVVKNVAGYDLPKLVTGALGTLGTITRAVFRLHPLPRNSKTFAFGADSFEVMQRYMLAIQDSKLAHTSLQVRCSSEETPQADILFEATETGLSAQELQLSKILSSTQITENSAAAWNARQDLWGAGQNKDVMGKLSILPGDFAKFAKLLMVWSEAHRFQWQMVFQATGVATLRLLGEAETLGAVVTLLRSSLIQDSGSFVVLRRPEALSGMDAWGDPGDVLALMKAVKQGLDPKGTLNPGRFVGGI